MDGMEELKHPAQIPDLNLTEHLRDAGFTRAFFPDIKAWPH